MNATLQILLGTYNSAKYLGEQLDSILIQDFQDFEILIHDGGSTDSTAELVESYQRRFPEKITYFGSSPAVAKENFALLMSRANAELVMFSDHDDVWMPDKISRTLQKYRGTEASCGAKTPIMVFTDSAVTDQNLKEISPSLMRYSHLDFRHLTLNRLLAQNVVSGHAMMVNRALLELALPIPPEAVMHDHWMALAAAALGKIAFLDEPALLYRQHGDNFIGAFNYSSPYSVFKEIRLGRGRLRERFDSNILQAAAFGRRYAARLSKDDREMLEALQNWPNIGFFARKRLLLKYDIRKYGLLRNIAMFCLS